MHSKETYCSWCEKPENQWTTSIRWWSVNGKRCCSARCFAAAEYNIHIIFTILSIPLLWFPIMSFVPSMLSEGSAFYLVVSMFLIVIGTAFTGFLVYMVAIGTEERRQVSSTGISKA